MKTISLRIGDKTSKRDAVKVPLQIAETVEELMGLARNNAAVLVRWATRGQRIEAQERSGARDAFKEGKSEKEIADIVNSYDPTVITPRTVGARKPKTITIPKGKKSFSAADLRAMLEAQGVKVQLEGDEAEAGAESQPVAATA